MTFSVGWLGFRWPHIGLGELRILPDANATLIPKSAEIPLPLSTNWLRFPNGSSEFEYGW